MVGQWKTQLGNVCVRGLPNVPPSHKNHDIFSQIVPEAEVPANVALEFDSGKPWPIVSLV